MAFEHLAEKLKRLPAKPGCYIYRGTQGEVLYVGKALSLKNRVRSYFQASTRHGARIERMVRKVANLEWIIVDSELEALVLECNLIKEHRPPFNVRLRDDKSYPYITITNERFPRVLFTRKVKRDGSRYFGPYTSAWMVRDTLDMLHKAFPLIPCGKVWSGREEQRPCLYHHLGQCLAPCAGLSDQKEYKKVVKKVEDFLSGKQDDILEGLYKDMKESSDKLDFEKAAHLRDQAAAMEKVLERQKVLNHGKADQDVIAVVRDERGSAIQMLYIRGGKLIGQRQFFLDGSKEAAPGEAVQEFVKQYYAESAEVPREVLLPVEIEERNIVETWLRQRKGSAVTVEVPKGGTGLKLIDLAAQNAEQAMKIQAAQLDQQEAWAEEAMAQLQETLELPSLPVRVEGYDISNIQGTAPVGSMVTFLNGSPSKADYRRFKVRYHPEAPNDFAMMHEVVTRRLRAYLSGDEKFSTLPDLMVIDGGKGQLSAALKARDDLRLTLPIVGLAKKMELVFIPVPHPVPLDPPFADHGGEPPCSLDLQAEAFFGEKSAATSEPPKRMEKDPNYAFVEGASGYEYDAIEMPLNSSGLNLLRKLRDEAHRFALSYHRKLREKRFVGSALEEIPGVGPRRKRMLLRTFGSVEGIRRATVEEIGSVPTMTQTLAKHVKDYLQEG
ncbi:MAG: excinuclease ABC subunit UvrC [Fimbriimonadaceae bacterium]